MSFFQMVMAGHGAAGLIAKALALSRPKTNWSGMSFESTQYSKSPINAFFPSTDPARENNVFNFYRVAKRIVDPLSILANRQAIKTKRLY
jgi:hypothetical protein